ncbi:hypothetical protein ZIOFF_009233 [Zingiber officinale]|uniref:Uncharacterized protein n=1 Tax=Zingiber officinale TaxID=94328 RepID=A0A8J5I3E7_ZINOF|nr:hypothetical protein ZIOFF_009233 [Zingiber officinale]
MDEMILLQSFRYPPKLQPGFYWYDKVSGYWGKVVGTSRVDFKPSDTDIFYAAGITSSNGLMYMDFQFPPSAYAGSGLDDDEQQETLSRCQLIRIHTKGLGENCKCLGMFEDVHIVIFSIAITDYNEYYEDTDGMTMDRMMESKRLFECIASHPSFQHTYSLFILSKFDLLEQKLDTAPRWA